MRHSHATIAAIVVTALLAGACATGGAFKRGDTAARAGDWDAAVVHYRQAVQSDPDNVQYKIALERAMLSAAGIHIDAARLAEARGQLCFWKMDACKSFHQCFIKEASQEMTTFRGVKGLYKFLRLPMGLKTGPAIFNRAVHLAVLQHLPD